MNQTLHFSIKLLSNCIVSQSSATAGDHDCLDHIPGSALLGVAASRLYAELTREQADLLFHSGAVRFGDALPTDGQEQGWPVPLCWHQIKGENIYVAGATSKRLAATAIFDPSRSKLEEGKQPKQLRAGHVTASGQLLMAEKEYELKTAINAQTGGAAESQLFGYQSLKAGQQFVFALTIDAGVDAELVSRLVASLNGQVLLGRSRSAQFGQAFIEQTKATGLTEAGATGTELRLWLLSDLALLDDFGNPLLTPTANALGLPDGSLWQEKNSFIRTRSYTPFNAKRRSYDPERQVISRGSVLVFELPRALNEQEVQDLRFAGQYQEAGLGYMAVNPQLLAQASPQFAPPKADAVAAQTAVKKPDSLLVRVLSARAVTQDSGLAVEHHAAELVRSIQQALQSAARWAGLPDGSYPADIPARTQWGEVRSIALTYSRQPKQMDHQLFGADNAHAVMRERQGQAAWRLELNANENLSGRIREALKHIPDEHKGQALAHACTQLMSDKRLTQAQQGGQA